MIEDTSSTYGTNLFYIKFMNNYLNSAVRHNTADFIQIGKINAPKLKGQQLYFAKHNLDDLEQKDFVETDLFSTKVYIDTKINLFSKENIVFKEDGYHLTSYSFLKDNAIVIVDKDANLHFYKFTPYSDYIGSSKPYWNLKFDYYDLLQLIKNIEKK